MQALEDAFRLEFKTVPNLLFVIEAKGMSATAPAPVDLVPTADESGTASSLDSDVFLAGSPAETWTTNSGGVSRHQIQKGYGIKCVVSAKTRVIRQPTTFRRSVIVVVSEEKNVLPPQKSACTQSSTLSSSRISSTLTNTTTSSPPSFSSTSLSSHHHPVPPVSKGQFEARTIHREPGKG